MSWVCASCGEVHESLPTMALQGPDAWIIATDRARETEFLLDPDLCTWKDEHFFVRCSLELPIIESKEVMGFGVWASLCREDFKLYLDRYEDPCRAHLEPMFGWLSNQLPDYPDTTWVKCTVYPQEPGLRPLLEIQPGDHPLARQYDEGVTPDYAAAYVHKHLDL